ncbi:hypothetical protein [Aureivirga sp. CE67]|uniref:hypothetical protein n=1 Tax=Aureivirga sp. CE67 TaxID=1788983 RepID=UPI0018C93794|nr:hypothetical protein [Aureivirga sp. CE67]
MGRPATKPGKLRDGFYIEVRNRGEKTGIKLRRETKKAMMAAIEQYGRIKEIVILGESKNGKWIDNQNKVYSIS